MNDNTSITIILVVLILCGFLSPIISRDEPKINLPEEISQVKATDTLKGYYDSKGVLHIKFNNKRNQR